MGNRGGRFHTDAKRLTARRWASRQWICCGLDFKGRRRDVWGRSYTELFFLDEPTAFAAGHRPCFECRRKDAQAFAEKWREVHRYRKRPCAPEMDNVLHAERLRRGVKRLHRRNIDELPDAVFAAFDGAAFAIRGDTLLYWTPKGYHAREPRPRPTSLRRQKGAQVASMIDQAVTRPESGRNRRKLWPSCRWPPAFTLVMQLTAQHQAPSDIGSLLCRAFGR
jgi:hypothetical protein